MNGLRSSNFKRIDKGLLFDIIIMIVSPLLILLLGQFLNNQMIDDGYAASEITMSSVTQYSSVNTKLLYVVEIFRYCGSALCYILVISGLDEVLKLSASYKNSRRCFLTLILVNAIALTVRIVSLISGEGQIYVWSESLYTFIDGLIKILLGASLFTLLRGNMDVLRSIGEEVAVYRNRTLSISVAISFPILGIVILADHFAPEMPLGVTLVAFVFMVFVWIYTFIAYFRGYLCAREVTRIRKYVKDLRDTFASVGIKDIIRHKDRVGVGIDISKVDCDYYRFLEGDPGVTHAFNGKYMIQYSFAEETRAELNRHKQDLNDETSIE